MRKHHCDAKLSLEATAKWFRSRFKRSIAKSTVSESLPAKWTWIDSTSVNGKVKPNHAPKWPLLDKILFEWQLEQESRNQSTTAKTLTWAGRKIWDTLPAEAKVVPETGNPVEESSFSPGWLSRFKKRHETTWRRKYGEAASVPETAHKEMKRIRLIAKDYPLDSIYNLDESGLYRRRGPAMGLSRALLPGPKAEKSRISITLCTNADGSDKHPPHFIEEIPKTRKRVPQSENGHRTRELTRVAKVCSKGNWGCSEGDGCFFDSADLDDFNTQTHNGDTGHLITNLVSAERQQSDIGLPFQRVAARQMSSCGPIVISLDDESQQDEESRSTLLLDCTDDKHSTSILLIALE